MLSKQGHLMRPTNNKTRADLIQILAEVQDDINKSEAFAEAQRSKIKQWHRCWHDWALMPFFDLAEAEHQAYILECCAERLRTRFNIILNQLIYIQ